jgi:signal transduction histidine kinase
VTLSNSTRHLHTYLNDHLAGSVAALELLDHLFEQHEGHPLGIFFRDLRTEISTDQETLRTLIRKLGAEESGVRKAGAWIAQKIGQMKIGSAGADDRFGLVQALEALALGISGKKLLWRLLDAIAPHVPGLQGTDFRRLEMRAEEQITRVEAERLRIAREIF